VKRLGQHPIAWGRPSRRQPSRRQSDRCAGSARGRDAPGPAGQDLERTQPVAVPA